MKTKNKTKTSNFSEDENQNANNNAKNLRLDRQGDDRQLEQRKRQVDFTGKHLDIPGRTNDPANASQLKDEENELYSQGSGHNDHLEDAANHQDN